MSLAIFSPFISTVLIFFICCLISIGIGILLTGAKFKKTKFIVTLSVIGLITLYFLFYAISNIVGRSSVKAMWKKVDAAGLAVKPEEIIPEPPKNPSENAVHLI